MRSTARDLVGCHDPARRHRARRGLAQLVRARTCARDDNCAARFPRLMFVIDAALQGRGIALVWLFAASRMLTDGQLVRASRESVTSTNGFHAVWRKSRDNDGINRRIATLLAQESAAGGRA